MSLHLERLSDDSLAELSASNPAACTVLFNRYKEKILNFLGKLTKDRHLAEDICQETFMNAFQAIQQRKYTNSGVFYAWIIAIARNAFLNHCRGLKHNPAYPSRNEDYNETTTELLDTSAKRFENVELISMLLRKLSPISKQFIQLYYFDGLLIREIQALTNVSEGTCKSRIRIARKKLLELYYAEAV